MISAKQLSIQVKNSGKQLDQIKPQNILQSLELFENRLTLNELLACTEINPNHPLFPKLVKLLALRWERIRNTNLCYTRQPLNVVNQLCIAIAKQLFLEDPKSKIESKNEVESSGPPSFYSFLIPSLIRTVDIHGESISELEPQEFLLCDKGTRYIPVFKCLDDAAESDNGQLRHMVTQGQEVFPSLLTADETARVSNHSAMTTRLYESIVAYNQQRFWGDDIGSQLSQLVASLRQGGVHREGEEFNAGVRATLGIHVFHQYWDALSSEQQTSIFAQTPELRDPIARLFRPQNRSC